MFLIDDVEIITVGTEVLSGQILDTNAQYLAKEFIKLSYNCRFKQTCKDSNEDIKICLDIAIKRSDCVVLTGGLGPTADDITLAAVAEFCELPLVYSEEAMAVMSKYFSGGGTDSCKNSSCICERMANYPKNATILKNNIGTACGAIVPFTLAGEQKIIVVLPGPPMENRLMFKEELIPLLAKKNGGIADSSFLNFVGVGETTIEQDFKSEIEAVPHMDWGIYASPATVLLRLSIEGDEQELAVAREARHKLIQNISNKYKNNIFAMNDTSLIDIVLDLLVKKNKTIACAESCTSGLLADALTEKAGASQYFNGSVVTYSNLSKEKILAVPKKILAEHGAVSEECARAMARSCAKLFNSDIACSITGIAGPTGATEKKALGTVHIAVVYQSKEMHKVLELRGGRTLVRKRACTHALNLIRLMLEELD